MGNEGKNGKVPLISKIAYGFGDVGCNFSWRSEERRVGKECRL